MDTEFFRDKTVLIMGLGRFGGGADSALFASRFAKKVIITDMLREDELAEAMSKLAGTDNIEYRLGEHRMEDFDIADVIIVNPAVRPDNKYLKSLAHSEKTITSQIEIFFGLCKADIIGITGANGKSTTTALIAELLKNGLGKSRTNYSNVWLGGNIGNCPLLEIVAQIQPSDLVVLELSSFQIEQLARISAAPKVSVITNLTPNHLDRHGSFESYCGVKEKLFELQKCDENSPAVSIFNAEDAITNQWFEKYRNQNGRVCFAYRAADVSDEFAKVFKLAGDANRANLAAAMAVAKHFGVDDKQLKKAVSEFEPLEHRLEFVAEIDGVKWYNDSIATTPESTIAAVGAFEGGKILIAGGYDKNLNFTQMGKVIAANVKYAVLLGQTAERIAEAILRTRNNQTKVKIVGSLAEAVAAARRKAERGDAVMLSPACASYDMFDNFQQRGRIFKELVGELRRRAGDG